MDTQRGQVRTAPPPSSVQDRARAPHDYFARLRARAPVVADGDAAVVVDGPHVVRALTDDAFSVHLATDFGRTRPIIPQQIDPPAHRRYRRYLDPLMRRSQVNRLDPVARRVAGELIDGFHGGCEFRGEFAVPFTGAAFLALLDLPPADLPFLQDAKEHILKPRDTAPVQRRWAADLEAYFLDLVRVRRRAPGTDLVSELIAARVDGIPLTDDELVDICFQLPLAGLDTTAATMALMWAFLAAHADHQAAVRDDPALVTPAVEELMRYLSPVAAVKRFAVRDTTVAGCPIATDQRTLLAISSANSDPAVFPEPGVVDFHRTGNHHYGFGGGPHRCLGIHFARFQLKTAMEVWHARIGRYAVAAPLHYSDVNLIRLVEELPLSWET
jgi:cytochrome P450